MSSTLVPIFICVVLPIATMSPVVDNLMVIAWGVIGATSVFAALNTYEVSIALLTKKGSE